ncbi:sensor domain-containing diguanylate cyclase [Erwinia sp. V71]|uniref:sensor domain-containing diguanylate cyclase n=1 Tax=Erwinia sp. V71 TaxID=3369424 RepID=UPI003F5EF79E
MKLGSRLSSALLLHSSLGRCITLFGVLLLVAVITINSWSLSQSWQRRVAMAEQTAVNLALSQARQAEDTFLQAELSLREVQRDLLNMLASELNPTELSRVMLDLQERLPQLHGLFYYDASGRWVATSTPNVQIKANNSDREYFSYHRTHANNGIHIGPVIRSRSTGDLVIPVSLRVNNQAGEFAGVMLATIRVDYFRRFYSYYEMGNRDVLVLMLADSTVLYARPMPDSYIGKNLSGSPLFRSMLQKTDSGSGEWDAALDGQTRIFGFARSERYPLVVAAGYDKNTLRNQWINHNVQDVVLNLALLASILLMGVSVLRQVRTNLKNQTELAQLRDELTTINHTLKAMALVDGLTGLANRRQLDIFLTQSLQRSARSGKPVALVMMDIDFFKRYNDHYGHVAGDNCLKRVGRILKSLPHRQVDLIARYGGEEFALVLTDTTLEQALGVAERAVSAIRNAAIEHETSDVAQQVVTLSAGCFALVGSGSDDDAQQLTEGADKALYRAKHHGRNQVAQ